MIAKRKNHFVWQHYIKRWSKNDRDVFYTTELRKIAFDSTRGLAMELDFYKCQTLSAVQLDIIKIANSTGDLDKQKHCLEILTNYLAIQRREMLLKKLQTQAPEAERIIDSLKSNFLEDLHTQNENFAKPILAKLAEGDITVIQEPQALCNFLMFLGHQLARTKSFKETYFAASMVASNKDENLCKELNGCWWFLSYIFGINIGSAMFKERADLNFCLLKAPEGMSFITSDQPVINVHEELKDDVTPPEASDTYFPISPKFAFMANQSDRFPDGLTCVNGCVVKSMNYQISRRAEKMIIGETSEDIEPYRKNVGERRITINQYFSRKDVGES